jgi:hypothetical protein
VLEFSFFSSSSSLLIFSLKLNIDNLRYIRYNSYFPQRMVSAQVSLILVRLWTWFASNWLHTSVNVMNWSLFWCQRHFWESEHWLWPNLSGRESRKEKRVRVGPLFLFHPRGRRGVSVFVY